MKTEAILLLSQELSQCKVQRDQFKLMAEQVQERFSRFKKQLCDTKELDRYRILAEQGGVITGGNVADFLQKKIII